MSSNAEEIKSDTDTNEITYQLVKTLIYNYEDMIETSDNEHNLVFNYICSFSYDMCIKYDCGITLIHKIDSVL